MNSIKRLSVLSMTLLLLTASLVRAETSGARESQVTNDQSTDNSGWIGGTVTDKKLGDTIGLRCTKTDSQPDPDHSGQSKTVCTEARIFRASLGKSDFLEALSPPLKVISLMGTTRDPGFDADDRIGLYHLTAKSYKAMFYIDPKDRDNADTGSLVAALIVGAIIGVTEVALLWGPVTDTVLMPIQLTAYGIRRLHNAAVENHFQKNMLRLIIQKNIDTPISHRHFVQFEKSIQEMNSIQEKAAAATQVK